MAGVFYSEFQPNVNLVLFLFCLLALFLLILAWWDYFTSGDSKNWEPQKRKQKRVVWSMSVFTVAVLIGMWVGWKERPLFEFGINKGTFLFFFFLILAFFVFWKICALDELPEFQTLHDFLGKIWSQKEGRWIIFSFLPIMSLFFFFEWFGLPGSGETVKINPIPGVGFEISNEEAGRSQSLYVLSVPAYRMFTLTGITLHPGDTITISASGIIATSSSCDWWSTNQSGLVNFPKPITNETGLQNESILYKNEIDLYSNMVLNSEMEAFDQQHDPNWRNPDGARIYEGANFEAYSTPTQEKSYRANLLRPDKEYGMLLGCILPSRIASQLNDTNNVEIITNVLEQQRENKIFTIGQQQTVKCIRDGSDMILQFFPEEAGSQADITNDEPEGQLVLLVNDVVLKKDMLNELANETNGFSPDALRLTTSALDTCPFFANKGDQFTAFIDELWYMDNQGLFTVTMKMDRN